MRICLKQTAQLSAGGLGREIVGIIDVYYTLKIPTNPQKGLAKNLNVLALGFLGRLLLNGPLIKYRHIYTCYI